MIGIIMPKTSSTKPAQELAPTQLPDISQLKNDKVVVDEPAAIADNDQPQSVVHPLSFDKQQTTDMTKSKKSSPIKFVLAGLIAIVLGVATGYGSYQLYAKSNGISTGESIAQVATDQAQAGDVFGSSNIEDFPSTAKGYLEAGAIEGEGTHTLLRPGGSTQSVTLTSSVTDLDKLVGMEIEIWGETFKGQKASWLMDVGRVKIIKVAGEKPLE